MIHAVQPAHSPTTRTALKIHEPVLDEPAARSWLINGHPARIIIWSADEWASLIDRPIDAQAFPNGIWCALRID